MLISNLVNLYCDVYINYCMGAIYTYHFTNPGQYNLYNCTILLGNYKE